MSKKKIASESVAILLEEIRSQNHATIEAVQAAQQATDRRFEEMEGRLSARIGVLEEVVRSNGTDIRELKEGVTGAAVEVRELRAAVRALEGAVRDAASREALERLERRVEALEKRTPARREPRGPAA